MGRTAKGPQNKMLHKAERRIEDNGKARAQMARKSMFRLHRNSFSKLRRETMKPKFAIGMLSVLAFLLAGGTVQGGRARERA